MEQELYYLIAQFLAASPCKKAAQALKEELDENRSLLPHTVNYDGNPVPLTLERLSCDYPHISNNYLLSLLKNFLHHFKETGDPSILRVSALRHGDSSLLTMLSAFIPTKDLETSNYLIMSAKQLNKLPIHRLLIARDMGAKVFKKNEMPTSLSKFYRERVTISGHRNPVYSVAFDHTNRRLFTGSDDFLVKVWCVRTGQLIHTMRGHQNVITDIAINQENTLIATASSDGCVRVWTMEEYKPIICLRPNTTAIKPFTTVKFSPSPRADTRYLMATNEDGFVRLWRWNRDTLQFYDIANPITFSCRFRAKDRLRCSSFNYTGTKFTVAGDDGFVYVFSTIPIQTTHEGSTTTSSSGNNSHTAGDYGSSQERPGRGRRRFANALFPDKHTNWQSQAIIPIGTLEGHMGSVTDLAYSHDGQRILSGCQDGTARIWTFDTKKKKWHSIVLDLTMPIADATPIVKPSLENLERTSNSTTASSDVVEQNSVESEEFGTLIPPMEDENATMQMDIDTEAVPIERTGTPQLQQQQSLQPAGSTNVDPPKVSMIAWSANDRWCLVASTQGEIRVYDASSGALACVLNGHAGEIYALDTHPQDSSTVLSAGYDGNVILWDISHKLIIHRTQHFGRTFTDCKFSKDGMKYAITDEEGHCTLFGIGGLEKDYELVRGWERGQYFISDYQALRYYPDGSFIDEATQQPPYLLPPSPIIDLQGVAYPNQKKLGYGRNIPVTSETFDIEDMKRAACYIHEEEEMRKVKLIVLPALDRATVAKKRREFVRFEDDEEDNMNAAAIAQLQFQPPLFSTLLPDDSADEDYQDDDDNGNDANGSGDSEEEVEEADDFITHDDIVAVGSSDEANEEEGIMTRSRAVHITRNSGSATTRYTRRTTSVRGSGRRGGRGGRGNRLGRSRGGTNTTRSSRKRTRDDNDDDIDDEPIRARPRRTAAAKPSYVESNTESESEDRSSSEDTEGEEFVDVENESPEQADYLRNNEAGPGPSTFSHMMTRQQEQQHQSYTNIVDEQPQQEDRKGKRKLRSAASFEDEMDTQSFQSVNGVSYSQSSTTPSNTALTGRATRSRTQQQSESLKITIPKPTITTVSHGTASAKSKRLQKQRDGPRELTEDEIKEHEPIPWITCTECRLSKYLPQVGDIVVILTEGHKQYLKKSRMKHIFDEKHGIIDKHEPVLFGSISHISWHVGPPAYCKLKISMLTLKNVQQVLMQQEDPLWTPDKVHGDQTVVYTDEDGSPEFIVLWERFLASMNIFMTLRVGQKVDAIYDEGHYYTGTVSNYNQNGLQWQKANLSSPWAYYHIIWDDNSSKPEDLCPWEIVPSGEDFATRYGAVEPRLTPEQTQRAIDVLQWLMSEPDFQLYVHQVNFYDYPLYLSVIAYPICLDMVLERVNNGFYRTVDGLIDDVELIKKNAMRYNAESSFAYKNSIRLANFFKTRMQRVNMPLSAVKGGHSRKRTIVEESDEEYDAAQAPKSETEEEVEDEDRVVVKRTASSFKKKKKRGRYISDSDDEDEFVVEDDEEEEYYE
ncbi:hypothetical protein BDF20DRAFT_858443 [Mycotypha africana]|uniref:uncharacterized protein n=1 Tax=Mycotypha africana TaxID=64632 RepID=UPI0022FFF753|nr:uncharacterized protein BDF20DRAFT_858443 [Mycotypha africana]KAI8984186.1 hypothetical protein BDF20DRAFT_858443 [Mycotypha africana]